MATQYETTALTNAKAQNMKAKQAEKLKYADTAALAGVALGPDGSSPADFFWAQVRHHVVSELQAEEHAAEVSDKRDKLKKKVKELPEFPDVAVERLEEGEHAKGPGWVVRES